MVCDDCWHAFFSFSAFQAAWRVGLERTSLIRFRGCNYQRSLDAMGESAANGCRWCFVVGETIKDKVNKFRPANPVPIYVTFGFGSGEDRNLSALHLDIPDINASRIFEVYTSDDNNAGRFLETRDVPRQMDSTATYEHARRRLEECHHHEACPSPLPAVLPTRVLDCSNPAQPRLFINDGAGLEHALYAALSYVWGEDQPHKTTSQNIESYISCIDVQYIPRTVRDAITVAHELGVRYLWVDSFCIVQDSSEDKAREISRMRTIFSNAYATIVAASANRVSDGFLHRREPRPLVDLPFICPDRTLGTMTISLPSLEPLTAPWPPDTRAWCLEERLLSQRLLLFSGHTLEYECQTTHVNIDGSTRLCSNPSICRLPDRAFSASSKDAPRPNMELRRNNPTLRSQYGTWRRILQEYTARSLTKPRDRLNALAGVAEHFGHTLGSVYHAGLWSFELPWGLLWYRNANAELRRRPKAYRAPSWSWAAIDGEVVGYDPIAYTRLFQLQGLGSSPLCQVVACETVPTNPVNRYGAVSSGYITLSAAIQEARWAAGSSLLERDGSERAGVLIGTIHCDAEEACVADVVVAFVCEHKKGHVVGLVLVMIDAEHPAYRTDLVQYRRVGRCEVVPDVYKRVSSARIDLVIV
ncbi:HET-domain-containing protein [Trichoderma longibrachiatum ATCC 18648]|uniref:HET-domain-containing protein n=1 Tax=Trichoderma longibrachiatum ATCC 18648 TaxID=983965 RepID=A0A2T4C2X7_TRILO|nr:HET-domain-containing protein [Trichoderma longibrachiatum ATCC 18648]